MQVASMAEPSLAALVFISLALEVLALLRHPTSTGAIDRQEALLQ